MYSERHKYLMKQWSILIQERISSGMTVADWCAENNQTESKYYYWLNQLRVEHFDDAMHQLQSAKPDVSAQTTESLPSARSDEACTFVELRRPAAELSVPEAAPETPCLNYSMPVHPAAVIRIDGIEAGIFPDTPRDFLAQLLSVLKDA